MTGDQYVAATVATVATPVTRQTNSRTPCDTVTQSNIHRRTGPTRQAGAEELGLGVNSILGLTEDQYAIYITTAKLTPFTATTLFIDMTPGLGMSWIRV